MEVVFVDPEPPGPAGGGIRTYLRLALQACRERQVSATIYTHTPQAYPGETALLIGRRPCLNMPWKGLAYRLWYAENVLWEHANWLAQELQAKDGPGKIYEFADFLGYGYFIFRNPVFRKRAILRVHTPNFLVPKKSFGPGIVLSAWQGAWREKVCLRLAQRITVPSAEFIMEKLPRLMNWKALPNPLPPHAPANQVEIETIPKRILYLGRVEPRKGVLPLVRVFVKLAAEKPDVSLTLVGSSTPGPYAQSVHRLIESQPPEIRSRLTWESPCPPEMRSALLGRFQILVVPSLWENSPYVYFEGMAAGLLCVGSATGEMKAVAKITGAPAVHPEDSEEWFRTLQTVTSQSCQKVLTEQSDYLRTRRHKIAQQLVDYYLETAKS